MKENCDTSDKKVVSCQYSGDRLATIARGHTSLLYRFKLVKSGLVIHLGLLTYNSGYSSPSLPPTPEEKKKT